MTKNIANIEIIKDKIHTIRGIQVILDRDLAELYEVSTKVLNQAVKRNSGRFPSNFIFQLTNAEKDELVTNCDHLKSLKFSYQLPYVFTEQGVAMLSGVLSGDIAIKTSIQIINAFVSMRRFISSNAQIFHRLDTVEQKQIEHDYKLDKIFDLIETKDIKPDKGIFFDGQIFDAYKFVSDLVRSSKHSIILIDNFVDDSVLTLLSKSTIKIIIYTKSISRQLLLDIEKYNSQYKPIIVKEFKNSHDRFMIIDNKEVYHFGASLKDLGKKWFAFSRFDKDAMILLSKLK